MSEPDDAALSARLRDLALFDLDALLIGTSDAALVVVVPGDVPRHGCRG